MGITRRELLGAAAASGALTAGGLLPGLRDVAFAADGGGRGLLVVVHLRGGCDWLNLVSPASDPDFIAARSTELRVQADGPDAGHALAHGPDPKIDFRLHAAAKALAELYDGGHLAVVHAVGLTDGTRSHFVATDMIERGVANAAALGRIPSGWLARHVAAAGLRNPVAAVSASAGLSNDLAGAGNALAVPDLAGGFGAPGGPQTMAVLSRLYGGAAGPAAAAGRQALAAMQLIDGRLARDPQGKPLPYAPEHGAVYEPAGDLARPLKAVAQLAKLDLGLAVATVDIGGWDTHEAQPGRFRNCVERLSQGIGAFYEDMWRYHDRLTLVTVSEFGRRLRSNRSNGTDHGRAGAMLVLGGHVRGGRIYGPWPGLASARLDEGVDLAVATDYRRVLTEVLAAQPGAKAASGIFPDYAYPGPLGLFAADSTAARKL